MKTFDDKNEAFPVMINIFTRVVTMIFLVVSVWAWLSGDIKNLHFSVEDVLGILLMGFISGAALGIFYIKKNMTARETICLHVVYFVILNIVLVCISLYRGWFEKNLKSLMVMEIMFVLIYFVVTILVYLFDSSETKKINQKLQDRKKSQQQN